MIRSELIQKIADENPHLTPAACRKDREHVFDEIIEALARGDRVELRGFGAFSVKKRGKRAWAATRARAQAVTVDDKKVPFFKTGKLLRDQAERQADEGRACDLIRYVLLGLILGRASGDRHPRTGASGDRAAPA